LLRPLAARASTVSRRRKLALFLDVRTPTAESSVIDVGVSDSGYGADAYGTVNFFEAFYPWPSRIVAVSQQYLTEFGKAFPLVRAVRADGRRLPFDSNAFDIGFSNAVVEHLPDLESQRAFVRELCRVSRSVFITTPNRRFPIDTHTLVPFAHWLPNRRRDAIYRLLGRTEGLGLRLLTASQLLDLFPGEARPQLLRRRMTLIAVADTSSVSGPRPQEAPALTPSPEG
jgi:Methyltransferase domain